MRGCFRVATAHRTLNHVLPAYAGMFLVRNFGILNADGSPRVCGDVSGNLEGDKNVTWFSPRMRGCFQDRRRSEQRFHVLPAYAGMFLELSCFFSFGICSPRVCGDVSLTGAHEDTAAVFSPRMRGCFWRNRAGFFGQPVLPAYAGMFPCASSVGILQTSSPRVCGDVSRSPNSGSPRRRFSPRMRGCFSKARRLLRTKQVLPAYAGMFPGLSGCVAQQQRSPRVCGDVSQHQDLRPHHRWFSPRMRGCFQDDPEQKLPQMVLPAYAGMFPEKTAPF